MFCLERRIAEYKSLSQNTWSLLGRARTASAFCGCEPTRQFLILIANNLILFIFLFYFLLFKNKQEQYKLLFCF